MYKFLRISPNSTSVKLSKFLPDELIQSWSYIEKVRTKMCVSLELLNHSFIYISMANVDGLCFEFGVRYGRTTQVLAKHLKTTVHGFDSFYGLPEKWGRIPKGSYTTNGFVPTFETDVVLWKGLFIDSIPDFLSKNKYFSIKFIHVDCDLYQSTFDALDKLISHLVKGTIIVFDEYLMHPSWKEDEYKMAKFS